MAAGVFKKLGKKYKKFKKRKDFHLQPINNYLHDKAFKRTIMYTNYLKKLNVNENIIFYESFHGKSMVDSPYAIFKKLIDDPQYKDFIHVWALNDLKGNQYVKFYEKRKNVIFVEVNSDGYLKYLAIAKFLINNTTFPPYFQKKQDQIYVNTWHGTPLKTLGKDMKGPYGQHKNIQRNFLHSDFILNPNKFTAEKIVDSHDLKGFFEGYIVEEGYPRIDLTINAKKSDQHLKRLLNIGDKKTILYAPTWRGEVNKVNNIKDEIFELVNALYSKIPDDYDLLLKVHTLTYKFIKDDKRLEKICVPDWVDTNELLGLVDILITDYSSIFFDFLVTKKPILFLVYDRQIYEDERGLYLNLEDMPGPLCYNVDDVIENIKDIEKVKDQFSGKYSAALDKYSLYDDGNATERIIDIVFNGKKGERVYQIKDNHKQNILMYCGGFLNNGITTSVINLLNSIDYTKYNVGIIDKGKFDEVSSLNFSKVNENVKRFYRVGSLNVTLRESYAHNYIIKNGLKSEKSKSMVPKQLYQREMSRLMGNSKIDIVIDFSGYVPFWSLLFAFGNFKKKNIYQHNDMFAEYNKKIDGKLKHRDKLNVVFPLYKYFDKVVAVAEYTRDLNLENLREFTDPKQAVYVHNCIDYRKIFQQVKEGSTFTYNEKELLLIEEKNSYGVTKVRGLTLPKMNSINFVNMGRLSPEKDQNKLIKAFAKVSEKYDNVKLYIIGDGVLGKKLKRLVRSLNMEDKIYFTGQMSNPFYLINKCDCFVLSSNHEGQPMVLLEALTLGKPIISTDIAGSRSVLKGGYGHLVENTEEGLVTGLHEFIVNKFNLKEFDYEQYNKEALKMFYMEVCSVN
ncbi:glycosyltransferase [Bacillus salipaludis]|uniref:CDP-glycerol glycerophosphotransferase family protein n=1 Tax=Bacillus salipaludis TaxID=2547811 RepID=UPI003D1F3F95